MSPRLFTILGVLLAAAACEPSAPPPQPEPPKPAETRRYFGAAPDGKLHIYFFDVGQGDAALIVSPKGKTVLVDTGPASAASHLVNRLPELLRKPLDLIVLTHPHDDHYGALGPVMRRVGAKWLMEPQLGDNPGDYNALLASIEKQGVERIPPSPIGTGAAAQPRSIALDDEGVELTVLWPRAPAEPLLTVQGAELEANSLVLRLTHGDTTVLFTGDAHERTLAHLLERKLPLKATLLKVANHGEEGSTPEAFLKAVQPQAALISMGKGTQPGAATLKSLEAAGTRVFRTDQAGEVQVVGDGKTLVVTPQRLPDGIPKDTTYTLSSPGAATAQPASPPQAPKGETAKAEPVNPPAAPQTAVAAKAAPQGDKPVEVAPAGRTTHEAPGAPYVASAKSKKALFHEDWCPITKNIKPENMVRYKSVAAAIRDKRNPHNCVSQGGTSP